MRRQILARIPLLLGALLLGALVYLTPFLREAIAMLATTVQDSFVDFRSGVQEGLDAYFKQAETIARLKAREKRLTVALTRCKADAAAYRALRRGGGVQDDTNVTAIPVRALGYARPGNFQRIWLEPFAGFSPVRDRGALRNGKAVGIVVPEKGRPMVLLAGDPACSFAVYVGKVRAPGIAMGKDAKHMTVKYIPEWMRIAVGDMVVTSGLDRIFPPGMPVGKVIGIRKMQGFKNAEIELFGDTLHPDFIWVVWRG
ncbi:MAG: rod shape-determining protein MreC [Epsilonproteobacteria bacterium]|jgi:rod shape-determining protein MreC|nr:rod shape-determining protein MreC [Campylobacterota bacterium]